ncbi:MAG: hypothetical protein AAFV07_15555, partial [Bacteroidota bacterium]
RGRKRERKRERGGMSSAFHFNLDVRIVKGLQSRGWPRKLACREDPKIVIKTFAFANKPNQANSVKLA